MNNHKLLSANFTDNEKTNIETIWEVPGEDIPYVSHIEAVETDLQFQDLLSNITLDEIHENTYKHIQAQRETFEAAVMAIAEADGLSLNSLKQDEVFDIVIDTMTKEFDEESLFRFKLKVFDNKDVKDVKDRGIKADIRKAKSISEVIAAFSKI